jgi:hypothetical protein
LSADFSKCIKKDIKLFFMHERGHHPFANCSVLSHPYAPVNVNSVPQLALSSVLPLSVDAGRPRPPLSKKSIDFDHEIMENEKSSDFDHEKMNMVEKNVGTPAILGRTLGVGIKSKSISSVLKNRRARNTM